MFIHLLELRGIGTALSVTIWHCEHIFFGYRKGFDCAKEVLRNDSHVLGSIVYTAKRKCLGVVVFGGLCTYCNAWR